MKIKMDRQVCMDKVQGQMARLNEMLDNDSLRILLKDIANELKTFLDAKTVSGFKAAAVYQENEFSVVATKKNLEKAKADAIDYLESLLCEIEDMPKEIKANSNNWLTEEVALGIIRRILNNFYKHIEVMYEADVHGKAHITKEKLDEIKIGNEYDVQRMLYSLIKPIFPEARLEVVDDTGYSSIRYDIIIEKYNAVIEVKCSRASMTKRMLTEEIAADAFHYKYANIFFFIYDKHKIIDNKAAFIDAYNKVSDDEKIETIVIQPVKL